MDEEKKYKILIVDDEQDIIEFLTYNLNKDGYEVASASNGLDAINTAMIFLPHLILLDVMMPEMDGIETCDELKKRPSLKNTIIAFLTARSEDYSQIAGFDAGADDYITKPIKPKVLMSRIKALLKRLEKQTAEKTTGIEINSELKSIIIDKDRYIVIKDNKEMLLPKKEFDLLYLLSSKPNRVFTRNEIFTTVWGDDVVVGDRTIDVHIRKLRGKIGNEHFKTIKGVGYKYVE